MSNDTFCIRRKKVGGNMVGFLVGLAVGVIACGLLVGYLYATGSTIIWKMKGK